MESEMQKGYFLSEDTKSSLQVMIQPEQSERPPHIVLVISYFAFIYKVGE